jgi:hypothetical protein
VINVRYNNQYKEMIEFIKIIKEHSIKRI